MRHPNSLPPPAPSPDRITPCRRCQPSGPRDLHQAHQPAVDAAPNHAGAGKGTAARNLKRCCPSTARVPATWFTTWPCASVDLRPLQEQLAWLGLSSLGRSESHVLANLDKVLGLLHRLTDQPWQDKSAKSPPAASAVRNCSKSTPSNCWVMPLPVGPFASWSPCPLRQRLMPTWFKSWSMRAWTLPESIVRMTALQIGNAWRPTCVAPPKRRNVRSNC